MADSSNTDADDARLTSLAYTSNAGATTIDMLGWGYDAANNVTSFTSIDGAAAYGYDPTNQLTSATYVTASGGHQPANENFSFDANGNRNMSGYTTGGDNLMSSDGTYNYQHDADGNTISRTQIASTYSTQYLTTYTWDYRNRLTDVEYYDNNNVLTKHVHYVYGVFDHLLATEVDPTGGGTYTQIEHYVLDVSPEIPVAGVPGTALAQPDLEFNQNGNLTERNLVALNPAAVDAVVAQESVNPSGDVVTWIAADHLGSPVDVVSNSGAEDDHIIRSAFGQVAYESNSGATPWAGFGGGHLDPNTGLVNDYHRYYDPATGRWLNEDPSGFLAGDANLGRYAFNGPATLSDSTGLSPEYSLDSQQYNNAMRQQEQDQIKLQSEPTAEDWLHSQQYLDAMRNEERSQAELKKAQELINAASQLKRQKLEIQAEDKQILEAWELSKRMSIDWLQKQQQWKMNLWGGGGAFPGFDTDGTWWQFRKSGEPYYGPDGN